MAGGVQRVGDANAGGGLIMSGDPTVLVNGRPIALMGSPVTPHPPCGAKGGQAHCRASTTVNQFTVLVNGKPISTAGAIDTCGHPRGVGSLDVIVGGL
jgi:uncharacterized Zn-binding protein involved in type VI secretion